MISAEAGGTAHQQKIAKQVQQITQYYPHPPVKSKIPPAQGCPLDS
jgi:hypothetical protein